MAANETMVPMDPHVVLAQILSKLDRIAEALESVDDSLGMISDYAEAVDAALFESHGGKDVGKRFTPAAFLRNYSTIREQQQEEVDEDEEVDLPTP